MEAPDRRDHDRRGVATALYGRLYTLVEDWDQTEDSQRREEAEQALHLCVRLIRTLARGA